MLLDRHGNFPSRKVGGRVDDWIYRSQSKKKRNSQAANARRERFDQRDGRCVLSEESLSREPGSRASIEPNAFLRPSLSLSSTGASSHTTVYGCSIRLDPGCLSPFQSPERNKVDRVVRSSACLSICLPVRLSVCLS